MKCYNLLCPLLTAQVSCHWSHYPDTNPSLRETIRSFQFSGYFFSNYKKRPLDLTDFSFWNYLFLNILFFSSLSILTLRCQQRSWSLLTGYEVFKEIPEWYCFLGDDTYSFYIYILSVRFSCNPHIFGKPGTCWHFVLPLLFWRPWFNLDSTRVALFSFCLEKNGTDYKSVLGESSLWPV